MTIKEEPKTLEFKWGKKRGKGGKKRDIQFYESFTLNGVDYALFDTVYLKNGAQPEPPIGKIIKIWETAGEKARKIKIQRFVRPCEISNLLTGIKIYYNELFLACGDSDCTGPAIINPVESVAGKCNVVCISKDSRNPQPSDKAFRKAGFVFYRYFDFGQSKIVEEVDDKIAGIEVKHFFNKAA
ncbi:unnamed protein product [Lathyrus sativus]|nr:unnamed protein product [Lathyrus sativus]